jgi:hypothetical protein
MSHIRKTAEAKNNMASHIVVKAIPLNQISLAQNFNNSKNLMTANRLILNKVSDISEETRMLKIDFDEHIFDLYTIVIESD